MLKQRFSIVNLRDLILTLVLRGAFDSISSFIRWDRDVPVHYGIRSVVPFDFQWTPMGLT